MKTLEKLRYVLKYCKEYGMICFLLVEFSNRFPYKEGGSKTSWKFLQKKHAVILKHLTKRYYVEPESVSEEEFNNNILFKNCIWTAWLQGEDNAPEVIRLTLASIRKHANGHRVIVLTNETIEQYIDVPKLIKRKYETGILRYAHYADVLRMIVLAKYGGIWLDATMLLTGPIHEDAFSNLFYSVGVNRDRSRFISESKWIVGVIGGCFESRYLAAISNMLNRFWEEHDICIDYFVFDYLISVLYRENEAFSKIVDKLPKLVFFTTELLKIINNPYNKKELNRLLQNGQMYYLPYKYEYNYSTETGLKTNYAYLCDEYIKTLKGFSK